MFAGGGHVIIPTWNRPSSDVLPLDLSEQWFFNESISNAKNSGLFEVGAGCV